MSTQQARQRRQPLGDATHRANERSTARPRPEKPSSGRIAISSPRQLPHNESLVPNSNGTLTVRHGLQAPSPGPENKRISAVVNEETRPHNPKRDSEISNASTNASNSARRRKTHIGPWQLGKTIGRGGCSRVRIVRHSLTGEHGAAKIISKTIAEQVRALSLANLCESAANGDPSLAGSGCKLIPFGLEREICIMKLLDHPNIVRLHDIWENRNEIYLIMEYVEGGELFHYIGEQGMLEEIEVVFLFRQILAALEYCHRLHIHHRDLKPENILLDRRTMQIKLVDFGMAALQPQGKMLTTPCGSPHYAAPEVIMTTSYDGAKADIWSCGVILFVMLTGDSPFHGAGEEGDLRSLFTAIARADYVMPDTLSSEAQDLIRRILVPDPKRRLSIEAIWRHPFMHKYDSNPALGGEKAKFEHWVGARPSLTAMGWEPLDKSTIDREIFRYLRTLWHSESEEVLMTRLLSDKNNDEKYFYSALAKYRNEQLEDYSPGAQAISYSTSDHHHHVQPPRERERVQRSQSAFSILNDEHMYSKHSFYEPPPSEASYDPFRASRAPLMPQKARSLNQNITVHRGSGSSCSSRKLRPATALGHYRTGSSLRIQTLRQNSNRQSSAVSRGSSKRSGLSSVRSGPSTRSQRSAVVARRSVSRSSMATSHWPSSPPVFRSGSRSGSARRRVSFSHPGHSSVCSTPRAPMTETPTPPNRFVSVKAASPLIPRVRMRKPDSPNKYIQSEARKVSMELGKVMEEAFNRSSLEVGSSVRSSVAEPKGTYGSGCDTPPTSLSTARDSTGSNFVTPLNNSLRSRPLPPIPDETPTSFLQRKLAETREQIAMRLEREGKDISQYQEALDNLDRLLQPVNNGNKRTCSAPTKSPELPVISEETKTDGDRYNSRAVTDPVRPLLRGHRSAFEQSNTIRLVDDSPAHVAPLNIRKRSGASTVARGANEGLRWAETPPRPQIPGQPRKTSDLRVFPLPNTHLAPVASVRPDLKEKEKEKRKEKEKEEEEERTLKKRKSLWFRRNGDGKENEQPIQPKPSTGRLRIPEAWQGLDDRLERGAVNPPKTAQSDSNSSEFPMRNSATTAGKQQTIKERKSFLGLFGKKTKEEKGKGSLEIRSEFSTSSIFSGSDFTDDGPGAARSAGSHTNWFYRFLNIKPASRVLCFRVSRGRARGDMVRLLRDWQRFGVRDVTYNREANTIHFRIDKNNHLKIKPVSVVIEIFVVLEHGRRARLCVARFTQTKGAASSFRKVTDIVEDVFRARDMVVQDETKRAAMCALLGA
ncbi:Pkinase-domain-containing protein [Westerdykella ornata]|uniref:non-specific serine/threonine protein kinase n=1 Tax=Westerdykella ornata TaxID=318751 RepID=A0A6A6J6Z9_WESOR|nr:Pkinase-domain-containing protein [Westerdykella ornata]KAF2271997.1 Pkinase-domain-containing protein [Westerdykella ornata]